MLVPLSSSPERHCIEKLAAVQATLFPYWEGGAESDVAWQKNVKSVDRRWRRLKLPFPGLAENSPEREQFRLWR